ncbi:MAG: hypothetical protein QOG76_2371 [Pseudonocardiales bacterium]|nr:hypothetical protein [Pseudonocardiales bacterium]
MNTSRLGPVDGGIPKGGRSIIGSQRRLLAQGSVLRRQRCAAVSLTCLLKEYVREAGHPALGPTEVSVKRTLSAVAGRS